MSKKSRRSKSKYQTGTAKATAGRQAQQANLITQNTTEPVTAGSQMSSATLGKSQHPVTDYSYVVRDIRYIGILSGSLIAILIILSFILG